MSHESQYREHGEASEDTGGAVQAAQRHAIPTTQR